MNLLGAVRYYLAMLTTTTSYLLVMAGEAWAKSPAKTADEDTGGSWVMPYALVIFVVAIGLVIVCNSSKRTDSEKPKDCGEED